MITKEDLNQLGEVFQYIEDLLWNTEDFIPFDDTEHLRQNIINTLDVKSNIVDMMIKANSSKVNCLIKGDK